MIYFLTDFFLVNFIFNLGDYIISLICLLLCVEAWQISLYNLFFRHTIFSVNGTHSSASWENCAGFVQATEPLIKTSAVCTSVTQCGQKRTGNSLMKQPIFKRAKIDLKFNNDHNVVERTGSSRKECSESGLDKQVEGIKCSYILVHDLYFV